MYNNNFDGENNYRPTYPYLYAQQTQPAPRKKTGSKLLKALGCGLLALVFTATVSVGSIWGYVHFVEKDRLQGGSSLPSGTQTSHTVTQTIYVQPELSGDGVLTTAQVYQKAQNWVVAIKCQVIQTVSGSSYGDAFGGMFGGQDQSVVGTSTGTGIVYRQDGYILTNAHVVDGASQIEVTLNNGQSYEATVVGSDADIDLALLKIDTKGLEAAQFGDSESLVVGEEAIVIGNPLGSEFANTCTQGIISYNGRAVEMEDNLIMDLVQVDAAVSPGNSGGPLLNNRGQVVGVISAKIAEDDVEGIGFAIPANTAVRVAQDFLEYGYYRSRPMIGMTVQTVTQQQAQYYGMEAGITVTDVSKGGAADLAGVQVGDKILAINGQTAESAGQLNYVKERSQVGDTIVLTVERNGQKLDLELVLQPATQEQTGTQPVQPESGSQQGGQSQMPQNPQGGQSGQSGQSGRLPLPQNP